MTKVDEVLFKLYKPFTQVYERKGPGNKTFKYIKARQVMNRLTDVLGPAGWEDEYEVVGDKVICKLTVHIRDDNGNVVSITRCDTGEPGIGEDLDGDKSLFSDSYKRAAVKFGVGLYLYTEGVPEGAMAFFENGHREMALPARVDSPNGHTNGIKQAEWAVSYKCPKHGKALWAWTRDREKEFHVEALNQLGRDPEIKTFPKFMGDWSEDQVQIGYLKLVDLWKASGVWPESGQSEPKPQPRETGEIAPRVSTTSIQPPPSEDVQPIKQHLRNKVVELICAESGAKAEDIKYNQFLERLNRLGAEIDIYIDNWAPFRDKDKLMQLGTKVMEELANMPADDIPF